MVAELKELVLIESPTHDKAACDQLCAVLADKFRQLGGRVKAASAEESGRPPSGGFRRANGPQAHPAAGPLRHRVRHRARLATMPWRESKGLVYGPGVFDMKGGIVQMMFAIRALQEQRAAAPSHSPFCWSPTKKRAARPREPSPRSWPAAARRCWCASPQVAAER